MAWKSRMWFKKHQRCPNCLNVVRITPNFLFSPAPTGAIREIRKVEGNCITVHLPDNYRSREVEVLVLPFNETRKIKSDLFD